MTKILLLIFSLFTFTACVNEVELDYNSPKDGGETLPADENTQPEFDVLTVKNSVEKGQGQNSSTENQPIDCLFGVTDDLINITKLRSLAKLSSKVAFGGSIYDDYFTCGECTTKINCIPGKTVSVSSYFWTSGNAPSLLSPPKDYVCGGDGLITLSRSANEISNADYLKIEATMDGLTDAEVLHCEN